MLEIQQTFGVCYSYPVCFTRSAFEPENQALRRVLLRAGTRRHRLLLVIDSGVLASDGQLVERLCRYGDANGDVMEFVEERE